MDTIPTSQVMDRKEIHFIGFHQVNSTISITKEKVERNAIEALLPVLQRISGGERYLKNIL